MIFVLSGPSGVGKNALIGALQEVDPSIYHARSATTRPPRREGEYYHFLTRDQFEEGIRRNEFAEFADYGGHYYGTPLSEVTPGLTGSGTDVILDIECVGAMKLREKFPAKFVFLMAERDAIEARLRSRGTENQVEVAQRLAMAYREMGRAESYGAWIENGSDLNAAVRELDSLIALWRYGGQPDERRFRNPALFRRIMSTFAVASV